MVRGLRPLGTYVLGPLGLGLEENETFFPFVKKGKIREKRKYLFFPFLKGRSSKEIPGRGRKRGWGGPGVKDTVKRRKGRP